MRRWVAVGLAVIGLALAGWLANRARLWNDELAIAEPPLASEHPHLDDPHTPRLSRRVILILIDGLGAGQSALPYLDELRARGVGVTARVPYPTISRPNYVTILTGVPPRDSGVRANRVEAPVRVDTAMDRAQAAGLRVATASDYGMLPSLFVRGQPTIQLRWVESGDHVSPPPPATWPVDEARRAPDLARLGPVIAELAATEAAFIPVLVLDVDRAGHASGVGDDYRAAARAVDAMLRVAFAGLDWTRDTVIVTADHGHVARGGHGGVEDEVSHSPLVIAGAGVIPGARARDARLIDIAPTACALLGLPAPGHAEGRALVELLALSPADAARRAAIDATRAQALAIVVDVHDAPISLPWLALAIAALGALLLGARARVLHPINLVGLIAFAGMLADTVWMTGAHLSPSFVPSLARTQQIGVIGAVVSVVVQLIATKFVPRERRPIAAFTGLCVSIVIVAAVRAIYAPPFFDVPGPVWMVAIPTFELAAATCATACALTLLYGTIRRT